MTERKPTREEGLELFKKYNKSESLYKHALSVEAVMRYMARKQGEDEEMWGVIGLIHDLDYEMYPEQHCTMTEKIMREHEWPEDYIRAVISHGYGICSDTEPQTVLEKTLFAIDELTGLVTTSALVRPSKSVLDMEARSVRKKWTDRKFAAGVDRSVIEKGAASLGIDLNDLITDTIMGMREAAEEIGLKGNPVQ
ncbi:MAG TPA: HDIG domain-containing protein [Bacteroidales bacterium]|nr:HDIG domain-containing protein [Bacteroidales bacterium]